MDKRWTVVEVMRHARHDWLNKIQLIKGHLALNKIERVQEIINGIIGEMQQETRLTNLKAERFAELVMTYNWEPRPIFLEYEVTGGEADLSMYDERLTEWCCGFLHLLEMQADRQTENHVCLSIELSYGRASLFFDYRGAWQDGEAVRAWLERCEPAPPLRLVSFAVGTEELTVELELLFRPGGPYS
ncbi:sporulation protein [Geobacillus subterraneus]|uniref:Sporulation protein n=2 Tax=Geobacillus TaxID=129337 RepID=A0ABN4NDV6_9BACL|nr:MULTISPECIES: sporulation initiation phosphotransferase B [Geobacillus]AMX82755.1 sporulation protein [Geobacillus subterraneus]KZS26163.1 sporulation protein [Geobacillus subterraneus]OXB90849.1 sporulation protein [Geobacillus uzenensis]QIZ68516.1 sporulation protein [Geobacillus subterraneus]WPZ17540.1 sporulation initiation phosphotransferase B [Geobacillus subterraneus]